MAVSAVNCVNKANWPICRDHQILGFPTVTVCAQSLHYKHAIVLHHAGKRKLQLYFHEYYNCETINR